MIKKALSPFAAIIEQISSDVFTSAHGVLLKIEKSISDWTDDLWAGDDE